MELVLDTKERRIQDLQEEITSVEQWKAIYGFAKDRVGLSTHSYKHYSDQYQEKSLLANELKIKLNRLMNPQYDRI